MTKRLRGLKCTLVCVFTVLVSGLGTGCYDRQELEEQAFVTAMAVDTAPADMIDCTFQFALPQNPAGGGGGGGSGKTPLAGRGPITIRAHSLTQALLLANASVERQVTLTHMNLLVFGSQLAQRGLSPAIQSLTRYREFRPTLLIAVSNGKASEVLAAIKPVLEQSQARLTDSIELIGRRTGLIPIAQLQDLRRTLEDEHSGTVVPLFAINHMVQQDPKGEQGLGSTPVTFTAGTMARSGGNPVEWMGAAVFHGDKMVGTLSGLECIRLQFLRNEVRSTKLDVPDPFKSHAYVGLLVKKERTPQYAVTLSNPIKISAHVPLEADLLNAESGIDYSTAENRSKLEQVMGRRLSVEYTGLLKKLLQGYQCDAVPVSNTVRRQFATDPEYKAFPWAARLKNADISVRVDMHIRRFGIQLSPVDAREW